MSSSQGNANQTTMRWYLIPVRMTVTKIKKKGMLIRMLRIIMNSYILWMGMLNGTTGKQCGSSSKIKSRTAI